MGGKTGRARRGDPFGQPFEAGWAEFSAQYPKLACPVCFKNGVGRTCPRALLDLFF
jgi:hypothetical protein